MFWRKKKRMTVFQCNTWRKPVFGKDWKPKITFEESDTPPYAIYRNSHKDVVAKWNITFKHLNNG